MWAMLRWSTKTAVTLGVKKIREKEIKDLLNFLLSMITYRKMLVIRTFTIVSTVSSWANALECMYITNAFSSILTWV